MCNLIAFFFLKYIHILSFLDQTFLSSPSLRKIYIDFNTKYERYDLNVEYSDSTKMKSDDLETSFDEETDKFD